MTRDADSSTICERVLRRAFATQIECRASIWLRNGRTGEWYEWDSCNQEPGHTGPHSIWSDRDSDTWAEWEDDGQATSRQVGLAALDQRLEPSPWTDEELEFLKRIRADA